MTLLLVATLQNPAATIDSAVNAAIDRGVFPGAVVVIGDRSSVLHSAGYGHFSWNPSSALPSPDSTLFDLASVTKVVATTPAVMRLVEMGLLSLSDRVVDHLPGFAGPGKDEITVLQLLQHQSGLRSFLPLPDSTDSAAEARRIVLSQTPRWPPGSRVEYSDLNAMLLGWIVEAITGTSLAEFTEREVFVPAGMSQTGYGVQRRDRRRTMPVGLWRGHVIAGELHDQNAVLLGGVSGHAGLYSTGSDLATYATMWLARGMAAGRRVLGRRTVDSFTTRQGGNRGLGWEMRDPESTGHTGALLTPNAYGHGGFTGTSIWIDPTLDLYVIVLTNRVFAPRVRGSISALRELRATIADAAVLLRQGGCDRVQVVVRTEDGPCQQ